MSRKIDFFIAGVQKGGTTALWHYLRQHPQIGLPNVKELHLFDNESIDWNSLPYQTFPVPFSALQDRAVLGEATPIYVYWPNSIERIRQYNPAAKIIVSFREPIARAFSHWRMETARGTECLSFSEAIRAGRSRVFSDPSAPGYHRVYSYVERGFYVRQVQRLYRCFPSSQVLLLRQIDLRNRFKETLDRLCSFLDLPSHRIVADSKLIFSHDNGVLHLAPEDREYLRSIYTDDRRILYDMTGLYLAEE